MLDRYRTRQPAPAAPEARAHAGAETTGRVRAAPAAPAAPAGINKARTDAMLESFAAANGIDWDAARSQMIEGDSEAGAAQLMADSGDGIEAAGVAFWLRLLAERTTRIYTRWPNGYREGGTGLDAYGRPLPPASPAVTCGSCQHYQRDPINPPAGAGTCRAGAAAFSIGPALHPMAPRICEHYRQRGA